MIKLKNIITLLIIGLIILISGLYIYSKTLYNSGFFTLYQTKNISLYTVCMTYTIPHCFDEINNIKIHIKKLNNSNNGQVHKYINKNTIYLDSSLGLYTNEYFITVAHEYYHLIQFKYLNNNKINQIYELINNDKDCNKLYYLYDINFQILKNKKAAIFEMLSYGIENNQTCEKINSLFY